MLSGTWGTLMLKRLRLCIGLPVSFGSISPLCDRVEKCGEGSGFCRSELPRSLTSVPLGRLCIRGSAGGAESLLPWDSGSPHPGSLLLALLPPPDL